MTSILKNCSFILLLGLTSLPNAHSMTKCGDENAHVTKAVIPCLIQELIENHFPELQVAYAEGRIGLLPLGTPNYFFKTSQPTGFFKAADFRTYAVRVNPAIYDDTFPVQERPSVKAVQGILAHELFHIVDYQSGPRGYYAIIGLKEAFTNRKYERFTDLRAMERGFAPGLKAYREWIYPKLTSPFQLKLKRYRYYTPEELDEWMQHHPAGLDLD